MRRVGLAGLLTGVLVVALALVGCGGSDDDDGGGGGSNLQVVPGQVVRAQQMPDGSFTVIAQPLLATGGSPFSGYTWRLVSGSSFPPGTTVNFLTGVFSGSGNGLTAGRTYEFDMAVGDGTSIATGTITLEVRPVPENGIVPIPEFQQPMGVPNLRLPDAQANRPYGASLRVLGGVPPYSWFEDETYDGRGAFGLSGLKIDMARGIVRGTVMNSAAGKTLRFRIVVRDSTGEIALTDGGPIYEIVVQ